MASHSTSDDAVLEPHSTTSSYGFQPSTQAKQSQDPALLHRSLNHQPDNVIHASGIHLTLSSNRTIIDACGGAAVACIGHNNEEVLAAATQQMRKVSYVHTGAYTTTAAESLASIILDGNPHGLEKAFFVGSGSEAMDAAMKLARQYFFETGRPERRNFVARKQSYHGTTIGAMSLSSNLPRKVPYEPLLLPNVSHVSPAYAYQYQHPQESESQYVQRLTSELDAEFQRLDPSTIIAFVAEPLVGATSGCVPAPRGYFPSIRRLCTRYSILLILDEVMCGTGRTGSYFAFAQEDGIAPDIVTIGKGLGGGYAPIAGVLVGGEVVRGLRAGTGAFNHGQTYQAHPASCASALAVQRIIRREGLVQRCARMGLLLERALREALQHKKYVGDVRGRGLFWGIEFVRDRDGKGTFEPGVEFGARVQRRAFELGVAVYPGAATVDGVRGDHVLIAPPYTVSEEEVWEIVGVVREAYEGVERDVDGGGGWWEGVVG
ncbi:aminotransferase class-III [Usnea florida]